MATDQGAPTVPAPAVQDAPEIPAIDNEIPTYRAISKRATFSLVCGLLASFSFANLFFLAFAVLAVALGVSANIAIKRLPEVLTGRRMANLGVTLGLIFGLVVTTYTSIANFMISRQAAKFSQQYADALERDELGELLWLGLDPLHRKDKTYDQAREEYEKAPQKEKMYQVQKLGPLQQLRTQLAKANGAHVHFDAIEDYGTEDEGGALITYAFARFEVVGGRSQKGKTEYALAILKALPEGRKLTWWVDDVRYPYHPKTHQAAPKPVDDGHGHAH